MPSLVLRPLTLAVALSCLSLAAHAQHAPAPAPAASDAKAKDAQEATQLPVVTVSATADAKGLAAAYAGGQVARGGRAGILGTKDNMETPFSITAYTNDLIQDRQAKSVAEVLQNDPGVRVARGYGNFQETYFMRGFIVGSDDVAYNGLYSLLPRQYVASELFERVEVLRGASAFLMGASPNGGGIGGNISLLPKRAPNEALTRVTVNTGSGDAGGVAIDVARRFGPDHATGVRFNAAYRDGGTAVDDEKSKTSVASLGLDWRSRDVRLSGDIGYQDNQLKRTRPSVTVNGLTSVPAVPDNSTNFAQPWTYSNERDVFGSVRGEWDINSNVTAWAAYGARRSDESNRLAGVTVTDATTGDGTWYRFDNVRHDSVDTGEIGLRGKLRTGSIGHEWVVSAAAFALDTKNGYAMDFLNTQPTNIYQPTTSTLPDFSSSVYTGNSTADPLINTRVRTSSVAIGDTLSMLDDQVLLTLGLRHQTLKQDSISATTSFLGTVTPGGTVTTYDKSKTSPVVGAVFKATKQFSLYGNYIEGLVKGDSLAAQDGLPARDLAPYASRQKELGVKYDGGRLGFTAAWFTTNKPRAVLAQNTAQGEDRHRGVELTAFGLATRSVKILGGVNFLDAKQHGTGDDSTEGKRTLGIPEFQGNVGVEWEVPYVQGLALDSRVVHTGKVYADSANTLRVPAWTRLDAGARYMFEVQGTLLTLRARVDNLTNKKYWASAGGYPDQSYLVVGAPRSFNLSVSADF
ncbi:iron complex outermembrane recepter protein [Roseateles sp. YR242]|uniref:TonB-dependent receptor n=1 Tax=Roseateles sp. YR242 TaxID=1855305 RepID=UPI0008BF9968|nr:TonB-dependent receptor [Roseateles sp. YR242]SEL91340.1 iron complex outermembrane recepter protein [Roseateles sp. YR242]